MTRLPRYVARALGSALLLALLATPAPAQVTTGIIDAIVAVQNAMIQASVETQRGALDQALLAIDQALVTLGTTRQALADPAVVDALGERLHALERKLAATERKAGRARAAVVAGKRATVLLRKLRVASKSALKAALIVGRPVVGEIDPRSAGFHHPGDEVRLQIYAADGSVCLEPPVVEVVGDSLGSSVDLGSVAVDETIGIISLRMGPDQGGVRVTVTACGKTATVLLYNYGPGPPPGLPRGFPTNLPLGSYRMTISGSVAGVTIPTTTVGIFALDDLEAFADEIVGAFREAARTASAVPGCSMYVRFSGFDGAGFTIAVHLGCSAAGVTVSGNLRFRVDRV